MHTMFGDSWLSPDPLVLILMLATIFCHIAAIATTCRRLHDIGWSGWTQLVMVIPIVNIFLLLFLVFKPGDKERNRYGYPPKGLSL